MPFSPLCACVCVCVCACFFFHCNHAAYTVKRGHDREVGGRGPRGLFKRIRFHERAFFLPLSFSFFAIVFFGSFFLPSHLSFVSINSFSPFSPFLFFLFPLSFLLVRSCSFRFSERSVAFDVIEGSGWISVKRLFVRGSCIEGFPVTVQPLDWGS